MIKAILIEDEKSCRDALISMLQLVSDDVEVIGEASTIKDGIKLVNGNQFDVYICSNQHNINKITLITLVQNRLVLL